MQKQYQTISSRELRSNPASAMQKADAEPIVILRGSIPRSVMVSFEQWNITAARLAYLERVTMGLEADARIEAGEYDTLEDVERALS